MSEYIEEYTERTSLPFYREKETFFNEHCRLVCVLFQKNTILVYSFLYST